MKTDTDRKIIKYIGEHGDVAAKELIDYLNISSQATFRQLKKLIEAKKIAKFGRPPKVFYTLYYELNHKEYKIDPKIKRFIDKNFLAISSAGEKKEGWEGFVYWSEKKGLNPVKAAKEYLKTLEKYKKYRMGGLISGMDKLKKTFQNIALYNLFYLDFYSIERFGKTRLGQLLLYAKQSQNKKLIKELIIDIKPAIEGIIKKYKIGAIGFVPPTVKRDIQFMRELQKELNLKLPIIKINKLKTDITVPQKTLNKLEDRVENARKTIIIDDRRHYKNVLLIDDAVGSGATINETAIKLKKYVYGNIIGLAITGSFKGFDVISEV